MIDLHIHILPGLDDGAADMDEAVEMAQIAWESGTRVAAATSHWIFSREDPETYLGRYRKRLTEFREELARRGIPLKVQSGMELLADESLMRFADSHALPGYGGGRTILVEFYFDISRKRAKATLETLREKGYRIVLAHPERYDFVKRDPGSAHDICGSGVILQVNAGSLEGKFGRRAMRAADILLGEEIAGIVASDAHDPVMRTPDLEDVGRLLDLYYGNGASRILLHDNPEKILRI